LLAVSACKKGGASREEMAKALQGIQPGEERAVAGVKMKMFRLQATSPLGDGWNLAQSTEGGFSVEIPIAFNDFRQIGKAEDGVDFRADSIGGKTPGMLAWSASCTSRRDGKTNAHRPMPDGIQATEKAATRWVEWDDHRSCVLVVEAQGSDPLPPEADSTRFLRSIKRTGAPVWR
jgi:hypothetical protein